MWQIIQSRIRVTQLKYNIYINSILAVIYLTKLQNLINRPVMNIIKKVILGRLYTVHITILSSFLFFRKLYLKKREMAKKVDK